MLLDENLFESIRTRKGISRLNRFRRNIEESEEGDAIAQANIDSKNTNFEKDKETDRQVRIELAKQGIVKESIKGNTRQQSLTTILDNIGSAAAEAKRAASAAADAAGEA